jgi:MFS family permease
MESPSQRDSNPDGRTSVDTTPIQTNLSNRTLVYASIVAFLAWVLSVYDFTLFGTLLPKIASDMGWSTAFSTGVATAVQIGVIIVALSVGPLLDYVGRKKSLIITTAGAAISSGLTAITMNAFYLVIVRAFSGLGFAEQIVNTTYLNELYGNRPRRGFIYAFVQGGWPIGVLLGAALTAVLLPSIGWRGTFLIATFPAILIVILGFKLRESPKFLAMQRVRKLEKEDRYEEAAAFGRQYDVDAHRARENTFRQIFEPDIRKHTIFLSLAFLMHWICVQVLIVLGTTVLTQGKEASFGSSLIVLIVSNVAAYIGYLCHGFVGDIIGRRQTIMGGWILSSLAYAIMLFGPNTEWFVLTMYSVGLFFLIGPAAPLFFYFGESYPTRMRGTGAAFVNAVGPIGALIGSALLTALLAAGVSMVVAAFLTGSVPIFLAALSMLGTRDVKTIQEAEVTEEESTVTVE